MLRRIEVIVVMADWAGIWKVRISPVKANWIDNFLLAQHELRANSSSLGHLPIKPMLTQKNAVILRSFEGQLDSKDCPRQG